MKNTSTQTRSLRSAAAKITVVAVCTVGSFAATATAAYAGLHPRGP